MKELPPDTRAQIDRVLADVELAAIETADEPLSFLERKMFWPKDPATFRATFKRLHVALDASREFVRIALALDWPATDRRELVATCEQQVLELLEVDREAFVSERRKQQSWRTFQEALRDSDTITITPPATAAKNPIAAMLTTWRIRVRLEVEELAARARCSIRTINRYEDPEDTRKLNVDIVKRIEAALTMARRENLGEDARIDLHLPSAHFKRRRRPKPSSKKRTQQDRTSR